MQKSFSTKNWRSNCRQKHICQINLFVGNIWQKTFSTEKIFDIQKFDKRNFFERSILDSNQYSSKFLHIRRWEFSRQEIFDILNIQKKFDKINFDKRIFDKTIISTNKISKTKSTTAFSTKTCSAKAIFESIFATICFIFDR